MMLGAEIGIVSGAAIAIAASSVLAHEDVPVPTSSEKAEKSAKLRPAAPKTHAGSFVPSIAPTKNGITAGVTGRF